MTTGTSLKRHIALFTASLLIGGSALAETVDILPGLRIGDTYSWDYRKETEQQSQDKAKKSGASVTPVSARVIEASATGYVLEWRYGETRFLDASRAQAKAQKDMQWASDIAKALRFELQLAPDGQFVQLSNYEQIKPTIDQMVEHVMVAVARERKADPAEMKQVGDMMQGMFASRERVEALILKDVRLLLFPYGMSLDAKTPLTYQAQLPNPFGGENLVADGKISLASVDRKQGLATIRLEQKLSPDSVPKILGAMVQKMGDNRLPAEELAKLKADITDRSTYTVDLKSGLAKRVEFSRSVFLPGGHRIDKISFNRTK